MSNADQVNQIDFTPDTGNLYREESITDMRVASIRRLIPIRADGSTDPDRPERFMAHTQLMSPEGPVPLQAVLKATTLDEAFAEFPTAMQAELKDVIAKLQTLRQQQQRQQQQDASRIIVPGR